MTEYSLWGLPSCENSSQKKPPQEKGEKKPNSSEKKKSVKETSRKPSQWIVLCFALLISSFLH